MSLTKILVVDDFVPWHHFVLQLLESEADLNVICLAADGLEAVQKAQELQPDVVLMDVNLPVLDGVEAARRIRVLCPLSKILFVSEQRSLEVIEAAFSLGASGYILKTDSYSDLILGVRAAVHDQQFVSRSLKDWREGSGDGD